MNNLDKFFDICKYNRLEKIIDEDNSIFLSEKEKEYVKGLYIIYRNNNVPFEVCRKIMNEIELLNKTINEKYGQ